MNYQKSQEKLPQQPSELQHHYQYEQQQPRKSKKRHKKGNCCWNFWNDHVMERFVKANLFVVCCVAAGLLLIAYLGAFSCEVSWILEAHGNLPTSAYVLCTQYFIVFVATTILIHGLVTGLSWGLFAWSIVIGLLAIPELVFVMIMTTQHWGLQSTHGLTELISYLVRLIINCFALICVIPTGLKWRRESQVLSQLQDLATRLQLQTPPPAAPLSKADSRRCSQRGITVFDNVGYQTSVPTLLQLAEAQQQAQNYGSLAASHANSVFGSQAEFNASIFGMPYMQEYNKNLVARNGNRAQSLMDLRCTLPGMYNPRHVLELEDKNAKYFNITVDDLKQSLQESNKSQTPSLIGSINDPIYCSIEPQKQPHMEQHRCKSTKHYKLPLQEQLGERLMRNCISLENLDGIAKVQHELQSCTPQQLQYLAMLSGFINPQHTNMLGYRRPSSSSSNAVLAMENGYGAAAAGMLGPPAVLQPTNRRGSQQLQYYGGFGYHNYTNPYITANSKLSLGNESDDYRKYRDVAL